MRTISLYVDGSSCDITKTAGYGAVIVDGEKVFLHADTLEGGSTSTRAECQALIRGLEYVNSLYFNKQFKLRIYTDCLDIVKVLKMEVKGGKVRKELEKIEYLLLQFSSLEIEWIPAHKGFKENENSLYNHICDRLANSVRKGKYSLDEVIRNNMRHSGNPMKRVVINNWRYAA